MKTRGQRRSLARSNNLRTESKIREKGREQREAAESGHAVRFYIKEVTKRVLNPLRKSPNVAKKKDETL